MSAAGVVLAGVAKAFGDTKVLASIDLDIAAGEVVALLGPSGCGKTTLLRLIAGLEMLDAGSVTIGGRAMSDVSAGVHVSTEQRNLAMVFQNGALFPHLTVARNVGFGLERTERKTSGRIPEMLELVGLAGFGERRPDSLSGGQQQRVALARALAPSPAVVLMDEPFSNLDAVLREHLRREVATVVRSAGVTTVFVTHDRDEAFSIADRVAVMRDGRIVQVATPRRLYRCPVDRWVASFVGDTNFVRGDAAWADDGSLVATTALGAVLLEPAFEPGAVDVLMRPEDLEIIDAGVSLDEDVGVGVGVGARVLAEEFLGATSTLAVELDDGTVLQVRRFGGDSASPPGSTVAIRRRIDLGPAWCSPVV